MKVIVLAVASLALCSCGAMKPAAASDNSKAEASKAETSKKDKQDSGAITLDSETQRKGHITVVSVADKNIVETFSVPGQLTISEDRTWRVGSIAAGKVESVAARLGDFVRSGQVLARLHSHDVHEARAAYREAVVELDRSRTAETYAKRKRDRASRLLELKAGSRQEFEAAEAELANAEAHIERAQAEVTKERKHITEILQLSVEESGKPGADDQDDIAVRAPAAGVVFERKATVGTVVTEGDVLFSLTDTSILWMIAAANEADLSKFHAGQKVLIQVKSYPQREFQGRVLKLGEQLDPATRTLQIRIAVPNPGGLLKPEMYATASLQQAGSRRALFVPEEAIQDINGLPAVFVRRSANAFEPRPIKAGRHANGEAEILEGLKPGDSVVVKGSFLIKSQMLKNTMQEN